MYGLLGFLEWIFSWSCLNLEGLVANPQAFAFLVPVYDALESSSGIISGEVTNKI